MTLAAPHTSAMKTSDVEALYREVVLPTYTQAPVAIVRGKGSWVWDLDGRRYLDFFPGWGVSGLGHCHPKVVAAIRNQAGKLLHVPNTYLQVKQARLAREIVRHSFPGKVFFCNSGAEAVEAAIKAARRWGSAEGRYEILTMERSFHGRTLGAMTATGQPKFHEGFAPLPEGFKYVPFNDLEALRRAVGARTVAVMIEPIQGEGGIRVAGGAYLAQARALADEKKLLLIFDEVQTGMGRTGRWFAYQHFGVEPDLMVLAKSLGSGVPIGALVVHRKLGDILTPGTHASTYGGNPLVCAAALAVFDTIQKQKLLAKVSRLADYLRGELEAMARKHASLIREVRGLGFMMGLEFTRPAKPIVDRARELGLLLNVTQETVVRFMPALTASRKEIDLALRILERAIETAPPT